MELQIYARINKGKSKKINDDSYLIYPLPDWETGKLDINELDHNFCLIAVADGMGEAGRMASETALKAIQEYIQEFQRSEKRNRIPVLLKEALAIANKNITTLGRAQNRFTGLGATIAIAILEGLYLHIAWIGDCRVYLFRRGFQAFRLKSQYRLEYVTKDHSLIQDYIDQGRITRQQAFFHPQRNIITRCLGNGELEAIPEYTIHPLKANDIILVCTDGLPDLVQEKEIIDVINRFPTSSLRETICNLENTAIYAGGPDDVTLILTSIVAI